MFIFVLALVGLCLGSFVNALVWRIHEQSLRKGRAWTKGKHSRPELSILAGRSMCCSCKHSLGVKDLIPVLSWVWLRGRCRYCGAQIQDTPLPELMLPALFLLSYFYWPLSLHGEGLFLFLNWLLFLVFFLALAIYDWRWFLLPDRIVYPLVTLSAAEVLAKIAFFGAGVTAVLQAALGILFIAGLFYVLYFLSKGTWIGFGDVKLGIVLGIILGGPAAALLLIFIASLMGSLVAVPLLVFKRARATTHVPFGPFLLIAAVVVTLFGARLLSWYSSLFLVSS